MALKKKQKELLKEKLLAERDKITNHLKEIQGESKRDFDNIGGDDVDIASLEVSQRALAKLGGREKKLLRLINHALEKFDTDDFGVCEYSGEDIPYKRLEISPWSKYTVESKEELERQEKQYRKSDDEDFDLDSDDV